MNRDPLVKQTYTSMSAHLSATLGEHWGQPVVIQNAPIVIFAVFSGEHNSSLPVSYPLSPLDDLCGINESLSEYGQNPFRSTKIAFHGSYRAIDYVRASFHPSPSRSNSFLFPPLLPSLFISPPCFICETNTHIMLGILINSGSGER